MSAKIEFYGKTKEEIAKATLRWRHDQYVEALYQLATLEPFFSARTVAKAREMGQRAIVDLCKTGVIKAHKPLDNGWRIPLSAVREWDENTAVVLNSANGSS